MEGLTVLFHKKKRLDIQCAFGVIWRTAASSLRDGHI